eukprot:symbB.v1.2.007151.t4/scaffold435.1/size205859/26
MSFVNLRYGLAACCAIGFVLGMLLLGVALGYNSRSWQALRTLVSFAETQLGNFVSEGWWRFQRLTVAILQWVVFPAYVGHLVLCFLCGPVLHLSQHARASIMNSNPIISFVMQLFVGYVHLWGFAFMEGCIASVLVPEAIQRASVNFFVGAINCHRRLFGTMSEDAGATDSLPMPPHWATLKLALVHVAVHTPLVFTVWYLPAYLLDRLLGESLFPMLLVDHSGDVLEGLHRRDPLFLSSSMASVRSKSNSSVGEGQSLFVLELLQLYVLVLQCIRILETSPVMTKLISALLRCGLRFVGLGHFLVGESAIGLDRSKVDQATLKKRWMHWVTKRGKILGVASMLLLCCWSVMALVMALPLALGRLIVRCILSSQAKQISDFLPLSMGVVVASAWILVMVKLGEALPRILEQASALRRRRCLHIITCGLSAFGMVVAVPKPWKKLYLCGAMLGSGAVSACRIYRNACLLKHARLKARLPGFGASRSFFFKRAQGELLGIKGLVRAEDFPALASDAVNDSRERLTALDGSSPKELVTLVDGVSNNLCQIADAAELIRNVHTEEAYVSNASAAVQEVAGFMSEVNLDVGVYEPMRKAEASAEFQDMSLEARTVLHHMRISMEHEGIHLPADEKNECMELLDSEQQLSFEILNRQEQLRHQASEEGTWVPVESLAGFSGDLRGHLARLPRRGNISEEVLVPRDSMIADQILKTAPNPEARERIHMGQQKRDAVGEQNMVFLLTARQRLAKLRGYESWAHWAQRDALFTSPENVQHFLDAAWDRLRPGLVHELHLLSEEKQSLGQDKILEAWDVPYFLHRCKERHTEADEIPEFLTYASLVKGVELILSRLLGLQFTQEEPEAGEVWHPSVQKYAIRDEKQILGILYLDPFQRPGKKVQSAQFTLQGSKLLADGQRQTPKTCLVYALPPAARGLSTSFAATFMHEIGHAVHSLLLGLSSPSRFDHLVHYGGSYYCYLFNRVISLANLYRAWICKMCNTQGRFGDEIEALAAHVWRQSFQADPFNADVGMRLRGMLQQGSVVQTLDVIRGSLCPGDSFAAHEVPLDAMMELLVLPLGFGTLLLRLLLPLKVQSVLQAGHVTVLNFAHEDTPLSLSSGCWKQGELMYKLAAIATTVILSLATFFTSSSVSCIWLLSISLGVISIAALIAHRKILEVLRKYLPKLGEVSHVRYISQGTLALFLGSICLTGAPHDTGGDCACPMCKGFF